MEEQVRNLVLDYLRNHDGNLYAREGFKALYIVIFQALVGVETVWYSKDEDKVYLHCGCQEFEGDIDMASLSDDNLRTLREFFETTN